LVFELTAHTCPTAVLSLSAILLNGNTINYYQ
jgi:hypothetical protein